MASANQYEPIRYKYEDHEDAVLVTVDFTREGEPIGPQSKMTRHAAPRGVSGLVPSPGALKSLRVYAVTGWVARQIYDQRGVSLV